LARLATIMLLVLAVGLLNVFMTYWRTRNMARSFNDLMDAVRAQNTRIEGVLALVKGLREALTAANQNTTSTSEMQKAIDGIFGEIQKEIPALDMALTSDAQGNPAPAGQGSPDPTSTVGSEPVENSGNGGLTSSTGTDDEPGATSDNNNGPAGQSSPENGGDDSRRVTA